MKRALAMALGAMLVAGAVPASAKSQIDFNGHYRTYMYGHWNQTVTDKDNPTYSDDFYFINRLQLDLGFQATDEISVFWRMRAPNRTRWGSADGAASNGGTGNGLISRFIYGQIKQDWGTVSVGRLRDEFTDLGLASLGWAPSGPDVNATYVGAFDIDNATDGIHYVNRWDNGFQLAAAFLRPASAPLAPQVLSGMYDSTGEPLQDDEGNPITTTGKAYEDATHDLFILEPAFFWDGGGASFGLQYERDQVSLGVTRPAMNLYAINPAVSHSFGDFSIHAEARMAWGKWQETYESTEDSKASGYAAYFDVDYNYGPGNVNLAAWWTAGPDDAPTDPDKAADAKGAVSMGGGFAPLIVAYNGNTWNRSSINAVQQANSRTNLDMPDDLANHMALDLNGAHAFTDDLTLTYAVAYLLLNKTGKDPLTGESRKKDIGLETDLGLQIQLLDNLHFGTTFGYLMAGKALKGYGQDAKSPADAYSWLNTLTFNF